MKFTLAIFLHFIFYTASFCQELYKTEEKVSSIELTRSKGSNVEILESFNSEIEGQKFNFILRRESIVGDKDRKVSYVIDKFSEPFAYQKSLDITEVFDGLEVKSKSFYPGKPEVQIIMNGKTAFIFNHSIIDGKYLLHAHTANLITMELGERKNLIRMDINEKRKVKHAYIEVSGNGEYVGLVLLPKDVDYIDKNTLFKVYNADFDLLYSKKNEVAGDIFAFTKERFNLNSKGEICLLGAYKRAKINKDTTEILDNEDSVYFGGFYHRLPDLWLTTEINVVKHVDGDTVTYAAFHKDEDKICRKIDFLKYNIATNELFSRNTSKSGPNVNYVLGLELLKDEEGDYFLIGARKYIVNDFFLNNKNRVGSTWYLGNIWVAKISGEGSLIFKKQIQREYEGGFGHLKHVLVTMSEGKIYCLYRDTKRGLRVEKDKTQFNLTMPGTNVLNAYGLGVVNPFGKVSRYQLDIDLKRNSILVGVPFINRFVSLPKGGFVYLPKQNDLRLGICNLSLIKLP
ncbi:MAG: hypothetical protein R2799_11465 [Crocinitomicaceae bacterium]